MANLYLKEPKDTSVRQKVDPSIKSPGIIWFIFINVMLMWVIFFIIPVQIPFYLKSIGIEKNTLIGIAIAASTLFSAVASFSYSRVKDRFGFYQIFALGYLLMGMAYAAIAYGNSYEMVLVGMLLAGLGMGLMIPNANILVMQLAPQEIRGREIGRLTTFWFMGQFISPIVLLPFLDIISLSQLFYVLSGLLLGLSFMFLGASFWSKKVKREDTAGEARKPSN